MPGLIDLKRTDEKTLKLKCFSGIATANVGDTFHRIEPREDWTIAAFGRRGHEIIVLCRPHGVCPSWARDHREDDGTVAFCGDTVAAYLLEKQDGRARDARGHLLSPKKSAT